MNYRLIGIMQSYCPFSNQTNAANPDSYRPKSLTSTMYKVMERLVTNRLQWFVEKIICFQIIYTIMFQKKQKYQILLNS